MPKVETFLKADEIDAIYRQCKLNDISRSAFIRAALVYALEHMIEFGKWLKDNIERFK
jgi:hypothetical protein